MGTKRSGVRPRSVNGSDGPETAARKLRSVLMKPRPNGTPASRISVRRTMTARESGQHPGSRQRRSATQR